MKKIVQTSRTESDETHRLDTALAKNFRASEFLESRAGNCPVVDRRANAFAAPEIGSGSQHRPEHEHRALPDAERAGSQIRFDSDRRGRHRWLPHGRNSRRLGRVPK